jgi:hypothetical protein
MVTDDNSPEFKKNETTARAGDEIQADRNDENDDDDVYVDPGVPVEQFDFDDPGVIVVKAIDDERYEIDLRRADAAITLTRIWKPNVTIERRDLPEIWRFFADPEKNRDGVLTRDDFLKIRGQFKDPGIKF